MKRIFVIGIWALTPIPAIFVAWSFWPIDNIVLATVTKTSNPEVVELVTDGKVIATHYSDFFFQPGKKIEVRINKKTGKMRFFLPEKQR